MKRLLFSVALMFLSTALWAAEAPNGIVSDSLTATMPTQNTDLSALTDLAQWRIYWKMPSESFNISRSKTFSATVPGNTEIGAIVITLVGASVGDNVTIDYGATAIDENGNESAFSNETQRTYLVVDDLFPKPPALEFTIAVVFQDPEGNPLQLRRLFAGN